MSNIASHYKYAIYIDSRDINSIDITENWFNHGFFNKDHALIIFRYYPSTIIPFSEKLANKDFNFIGFNKFLSIKLGKLNAVFYPFNTNTNPLLIKQRQAKHIFIGHGESDKQASINPMIRMYDLIFSSGPTSTQRYLEHSLINNEDVGKKAFEIGMPYIDDQFQTLSNVKDDNIAIYCPTWEGASITQQYSSLESTASYIAIESALKKFDTLYFMPHPSTGQKEKKYLKYIENIVNHFSKENRFIFIPNNRHQEKLAKNLKRPQYASPKSINWNKIGTCISDISSIISTAAHFNCKIILLDKKKESDTFLDDYIDYKVDITLPNAALQESLTKSLDHKKKNKDKISRVTLPKINFHSNKELFEYIFRNYIMTAPS